MIIAFTDNSPYKKRARITALLWTLLIFILCLLPGKEIPDVHIRFIDKWAHFILFGGFAFLWLCSYPNGKVSTLLFVFIAAASFGWLTETLQGMFPSLGRTKDIMDMLADCIGALIGVFIFALLSQRAGKKLHNRKL